MKPEPGTSQAVVATINGWPQGDCWVLSALTGKMRYQLCPVQLSSTLLPPWGWQGRVEGMVQTEGSTPNGGF